MLNEFRQDIVSGEWVLFSTERSKRPHPPKEKFYQPKDNCPFEDLAGHEIVSAYKDSKLIGLDSQWSVMVIKNKYPALKDGLCGPVREYGPFKIADGNGFHELVITKDHEKSFPDFSNEETSEVIKAYKDRYLSISENECGNYILIMHNHGPLAGGTIYHNHSQIISTPILPPDVMDSIKGSLEYFKRHSQKVHDVVINWEIQKAKRIIYENEKFIAFCPFVSRTPYEIRIFPKTSNPCFHHLDDEDIPALADVLNTALKKIKVVLNDPDYNFFIHTAPVSADVISEYDFYHWHIEILPRLESSKIGGFELGVNIFINGIDPDEAAESFRNAKI